MTEKLTEVLISALHKHLCNDDVTDVAYVDSRLDEAELKIDG